METPVIAALLIHVIWLARSYKHVKPMIEKWVRTTSAISSLILTTALFCLIYIQVSELVRRNIYFGADSASRQVVSVISSPDNSICYVEMRSLDDKGK
ncbi:hypothetical protein KVG88_30070 [Pseudomonas sp. SWRI74]|uniref:Uncharacterized protein n=1 Tax=Pseudomonas azerbaijanoccidentalis TaxID=2842347 RepID=A0ABS6R0D1_9PSED|nr:hypothetical protein [Pseudomonas azerbaijanoccidentalis]MBV4524322.1 hypothetical protein [Pseudomonas azerbaijanoccidentalis]